MAKKIKKKETNFKKFMKKFAGLLFILIAVLFYVALFSYHQNDLSFNNAKDGSAQNLLGFFGASLAEVSAGLGIALPLFVLGFFVWGYKLLRYGELMFFKTRLFAFLLGTLSLAPLLNLVFKNNLSIKGYPVAGSIGKNILERVNTLLSNTPLDQYRKWVVLAVFSLVFLMAFNFVMGLTFKRWYLIFKAIVLKIKDFGLYVCHLGGLFVSFLRGRKVVSRNKRIARLRMEPTLGEKPEPKRERIEPKISIAEPVVSTPAKTKVSRKVSGYQFPSVDLLSRPKEKGGSEMSQKEMDATARNLEEVLQEFGVNGEIVGVNPGPVVTLYEFKPVAGTKTARVIGLSDDIARSMCAVSVRIAVVPGTDTIGIEIPNAKRETVWFKDLIEDEAFSQTKNTLNVVLGKDISGKNVYADLAKMPHLLVAGTTGSGKSVGVNSMILSLLYKMTPQECKMIMIDPKMLEFSMYNDIPHLLTPVITDPAKAVAGLKWAVCEMEERYRKISDLHVRNIFGYNQKLKELKETGQTPTKTIQVGFDEEGRPIYEKQELDTTPMPYIVIVVDEVADLMIMARKEVEAAIQRLAQKARAAGIHLIMATQRPSVDVITGVIKANFPTRISFQVTSKFDSMTILGEKGAEQLLGMGDMLYMPAGLKPQRVHGSFVKDSEVEAVANFLKTQGAPEYVEDVTKIESGETDTGSVFDHTAMGGTGNDLYQQAVEIVRSDKKASTSYIQRRLRIGYNRAADLIDRMEKEGIVGPADHVGRREVL